MLTRVKIWTIFILIMPWQWRKFGNRNKSLLVQGVLWATWLEGGSSSPAHRLLLARVPAPAATPGSESRDPGKLGGSDRAAFLVLLQLLAFPSQAEADTSLPHAESEKSRETMSRSTEKGQQLPPLWKLGVYCHARPWSKEDTRIGITVNEGSRTNGILASQDICWSPDCCDISPRLQVRNTLLCCLVRMNSFFERKQSWYCFLCLNADFCLGITKKPKKILHSEIKVTQGNC